MHREESSSIEGAESELSLGVRIQQAAEELGKAKYGLRLLTRDRPPLGRSRGDSTAGPG